MKNGALCSKFSDLFNVIIAMIKRAFPTLCITKHLFIYRTLPVIVIMKKNYLFIIFVILINIGTL